MVPLKFEYTNRRYTLDTVNEPGEKSGPVAAKIGVKLPPINFSSH